MDKKTKKKIKYSLLLVLVKSLIALSQVVPRQLWVAFCGWLGGVAFNFESKSKERTIFHLSLVYGNRGSRDRIKRMAKKTWQNIGRNFAEIVRALPIMEIEKLEQIVETEGLEHLEKAYEEKKGVICLTCHMGPFELTATNIVLRGYPTLVVGTKMKNPKLDEMLVNNRTSRGVDNVYRGENTLKLFRALKQGKIACLLIDQDIKKVKGVFIDFFGMQAYTPIGATLLALRTGATVVPMVVRRVPGKKKLVMTFKPPLEVTKTGDEEKDLVENTQRFSNSLEEFIREDPTQWVWMHERWKTKPKDLV